jgi:phosphatidate cytidylyltransferase
MSDLKQRLSTGSIFIIVLFGSTIASPYTYACIFLLAGTLGQIEFYRLIKKSGGDPQTLVGVIGGILLFTTNFLYVQGSFENISLLVYNMPLLFAVFLVELFRKNKNPFFNIAYTIIGIIYIALPFSLLNYMMIDPRFYPSYEFYPHITAGVLFCMWANDSWAYLVGKRFGKTKLYESVSPKKTWEGFLGGIFFCVGFAIIISFIATALSMLDWIVIGLIISIAGTAGDLIESKLKRSLNLKDSGNILPGHGGILDRFDALILAIPFIIVYLFIRF